MQTFLVSAISEANGKFAGLVVLEAAIEAASQQALETRLPSIRDGLQKLWGVPLRLEVRE